MGANTDFFIADEAQLADIFVGWLTVSDEPIERAGINPFTGEQTIYCEWPTGAPDKAGKFEVFPSLASVVNVQFQRVDIVKLASLNQILTGMPTSEGVRQLAKPALECPDSEVATGLHRLPAEMKLALSQLTDDRINANATEWSETAEMMADRFSVEDCRMVLRELSQLAKKCGQGQEMYHLWCL